MHGGLSDGVARQRAAQRCGTGRSLDAASVVYRVHALLVMSAGIAWLMAFLDDRDNAVVLRVVYAGPPMSGKTESVRALSRLLLGANPAEAVFTPGAANERTLFFDWLEYSGGSFQGRRIRCQIVSVPGQNLLHRRRKVLLASADAIVFVVDAHPEHSATIARSFAELAQVTAEAAAQVPVGIVVQANKSDLPNAMSRQSLAELLGDDPNMIVVPTIATQGTGVREAFVRAVGLALTRAHVQMQSGTLAAAQTMASSGAELLRQLVTAEEKEYGSVGASARRDAGVSVTVELEQGHFAAEQLGSIAERYAQRGKKDPPANAAHVTAADERAAPALPDERLDTGMVWPPIAGRIVLQELAAGEPVVTQREDGAWLARAAERWQLLSLARDCFQTQAAARDELVRQARIHAQLKPVLSEHRCLCAAPTGRGEWRIWQVVRHETTLADIVRLTLSLKSADSVAAELLRVARILANAAQLFRSMQLPLRPTLAALAVSRSRPVYTGYLLPHEIETNAAAEYETAALLRQELGEAVAMLARRGERAALVLRQLEAARAAAPPEDIAPETLIAEFLRHG